MNDTDKPLKPGTKVLIATAEGSEPGQILRWRKSFGQRQDIPGFEPVRFDRDGAQLMVHRSGLIEGTDS